MCRLWGWAATFVLITGIGQVQGVVAQLEITSMTIDTPGSKLVVCFTYDGEEVFTKDDIILMCWKVSATPDQKQLGTTNLDDSLEEPSKYCSTHSLPAITPVYSSKTGCEMNIVKNEVPSNISGSAEFTMPEADVFPTCENAYKWIDKSLVGVVCSKVGNFEKALIGETVLTTSKSDNVNYMLYTDAGGDTTLEVSLCTTTNNTALDSVGKLDICIPKIPITTPTEGLELQESELIYSSSGAALYVLSNGETTNNNDLVLITGITITTDTKPGNSERLTVNIPSYTKGTEIDFLVVNYNTAVVSSVSESIKDYELTLTPLTSNTLELSWKHKDSSVNIFTIERDNIGGTATSFTNATVECSGPDVCYGYFVDLTPGESYTCSVSNNGKLNKITGTPATMPPVTKDFSVKQLSLIWNNEVNAAAATVCVEQMNAAMSAKEASYHELIMINSQGQVLKTRQMVQKTENFLCFEGVHLETSTFDISHGKVTLVVVKRSADEHTILARGQTELLFISPEMGRVGQMGHVSWKNPEGYSFIARRGRQPAPLSTSNNGSLVHYFIPKTTGLKDVLVVETEAADVRMTAVIPLIPHVTSGM